MDRKAIDHTLGVVRTNRGPSSSTARSRRAAPREHGRWVGGDDG